MRIYLTGFMGSGKSTVGRILANKLNVPFFDLDKEIELRQNRSIEKIFESSGEEAFRKLETDCLLHLNEQDAVIATGGGCFIQNASWMLSNGTVVYLQVPFTTLTERIGASANRPLWRKADQLFQEREQQYRKAHFIIEGTKGPEEVAAEITDLIKK
jgi:shikimate kinase